MARISPPILSFVIPVFNEQEGLLSFHSSLVAILDSMKESYEIVYCDDGSADNTSQLLADLCTKHSGVHSVRLSRNFGKEIALSAGIAHATGDAIMTLDADGQYPVERIPDFVAAWQAGAQVVVGIRANTHEGFFKRFSSRLFYRLVNISSEQKLIPGSTDFRLINKEVQQAFLSLPETNRITRGLIDWLGFDRKYITYAQKEREYGTPSYSYRKLFKLAVNSIISLSPDLLHVIFYAGVGITLLAALLGGSVLVEQVILSDPLHWNFTGTAMLGILILFLVGLVVITQGILAAYIARILDQGKKRPLYLVDYKRSHGITRSKNE
ncbi:MAG: glycosyltransferase family 2 protein [Candidatus Saccharibacteria bacterium]